MFFDTYQFSRKAELSPFYMMQCSAHENPEKNSETPCLVCHMYNYISTKAELETSIMVAIEEPRQKNDSLQSTTYGSISNKM